MIEKPPPLSRLGPIVLLAGLSIASLSMVVLKLRGQPLFVDFLTMWTGGRLSMIGPGAPYDAEAVDKAQVWLLGAAAHHRQFPYPPTALLIFAPLARLGFWPAAWIWAFAGVGAFVLSVRQTLPPPRSRHLALLLMTPASAWAAVSGQSLFLVGALAIAAVAQVERRPLLSGMLLGLAAALKPTPLIAAPFALAAGGARRTGAAAVVTLSVAFGVSLLAFGGASWTAWLRFAPGFLHDVLTNPAYVTGLITPTGLAARWGWAGPGMLVWRAGWSALGVTLAALTWRRSRRLSWRLTGVFAGSLLAAPYAVAYETLLLAPGALLIFLEARRGLPRTLAGAAFLSLIAAGLPSVGAFAFALSLALLVASAAAGRPITAAASPVAIP